MGEDNAGLWAKWTNKTRKVLAPKLASMVRARIFFFISNMVCAQILLAKGDEADFASDCIRFTKSGDGSGGMQPRVPP